VVPLDPLGEGRREMIGEDNVDVARSVSREAQGLSPARKISAPLPADGQEIAKRLRVREQLRRDIDIWLKRTTSDAAVSCSRSITGEADPD
jgi:hypothetical protein